MGLFLGSLFCSTDLWVCFSASTMLLWLLYLCSIVQNQGQWLLQFCSSFSRLPWLFRVLCASIQILKSFALVLWEMPLVFWKELQWFCKLPWALIRKEELYPRKWGRERVLERIILWGGWGRSGKEELGDRSSSEGPAWHWLGPNSFLPVLKLNSFRITTEISSEMKWVHHSGCSTQIALRKSGWGSTWNRKRMSNPISSGHRLTSLLFEVDYWGHSKASPHRQWPRRKRVSLISAWTFLQEAKDTLQRYKNIRK